MNSFVFALTILTIISWGLWGFFTKISTDKLGIQAIIWGPAIAFVLVVVGYLLVTKQLLPLNLDRTGIFFSLLGGVGAAVGSLAFITILKQQQVSLVVPFTALYPAVTVILAVLFLNEKLTASQFLGVMLAIAAIFLFSRT